MQTGRPLTLDETLAIAGHVDRLHGLRDYLARVEVQAERARAARFDTVRQLRVQGVTWRSLSAETGLSEQYLRAMVKA